MLSYDLWKYLLGFLSILVVYLNLHIKNDLSNFLGKDIRLRAPKEIDKIKNGLY